ncbi:MAG: hypothetical protein HKN43_08675 [Rhodothermales bacterium]|nr:hypothetical protein [Rhodothermales bacterium]
MPQTLIALGALVLVMLFSMSQQRSSIQHSQNMVSAELEVMANASAKEMMQLIGSKPFDARIADGTIAVQASDDATDLLTAPAQFGYNNSFDDCEDIDDFNRMAPDTLYFDVNGDVGFEFIVDVEVNYVNSEGEVSSTPTWIKEVTLTVNGLTPDSGLNYLKQPIVLKRQFSPQWN